MNQNLVIVAVVRMGVFANAAEPAWVGHRGPNGSGVFPDAKVLWSGVADGGHAGIVYPAGKGVLSWFTLDGKKGGELMLDCLPSTGEKAQQIQQQDGAMVWQFSESCPFTIAGDRLYVRSHDELICLGGK